MVVNCEWHANASRKKFDAIETEMISRESPRSAHRFILQAIDPALGCSVLEAMLLVTDLETLLPLLGVDAANDAELRESYVLDPDALSAITYRSEILFDPAGRECWLSRAHSVAYAPYLVHTGRELAAHAGRCEALR